MTRINKKPGDLLRFPLSAEEQYGYCQWLADGTARIFLTASFQELSPSEVLVLPDAFRVLVFRDTPNRYGWTKVGKASVPDEFSLPQRYAKQDPISGRITVYVEGDEFPATYAEVQGLETVAVWAHPHIVERLEAQLDGRESTFLRSLQIVER